MEDTTMKRLITIMITLLFSFALVLPVNATESDITSLQLTTPNYRHHPMPWPPWDDDNDDEDPYPWGGRHHGGIFKVADLTGDDVSEIILLEDETLTVMNNEGDVLFTKTIDIIEDHHGGWWSTPMFGNHNHEVGLDVSNLDDDLDPEIIILDAEKLIVLDNEGNLKYTIALP